MQKPFEENIASGPQVLRKKRAAQAERNTCQLYIQTDHLFYKHYGTREAVIAQVFVNHGHYFRNMFCALLTKY